MQYLSLKLVGVVLNVVGDVCVSLSCDFICRLF